MPEAGKGILNGIADRVPPYVMLLIAVTTTVVSATGAYVTLGRDIRDLDNWKVEHLEHHRERAADLAAQFSAVNQRLSGFDEDRRRIDQLTFRIGSAEENTRNAAEANAQLQSTVNALAGDMRVMREILERLDQRRAELAPTARARTVPGR